MIRLGLEDYRPERQPEQRMITLADFPHLAHLLSPPQSGGVVVNEQTALNFSAYFNGVDIISGQIGITPRIPYRRVGDDERERAKTHPTYRLLHDQPNPYTTDAVFWQTLMAHVLTWGNGYGEIEFDNALRPIALWIIPPDQMEPKIETRTLGGGRSVSKLYYLHAGKRRIEAEDVIHIPGLGFDGIRGYSVVQMARRSLGLGLAAEQFGSSFLARGASSSIALEHPKSLSPKAKTNIRESIEGEHAGVYRAGGTMVLEEGMTAKVLGIPQRDAQFLESREFQVVEVARWLNLPPHKLKHKYGERPGGNLEAAQIEFQTDTLDPWYVRIEQELTRKLFPASQRSTFYVEHLVEARLRLDSAARIAEQKAYFDMGVLSAAQIAKQQNLPPPEEKEPAPALPPAPAPLALPPAPPDARMLSAVRSALIDAAARFGRREAKQVRRAAKRPAAEFGPWVEKFCEEELEVLRAHLLPVVTMAIVQRGLGCDPGAVSGKLAAVYLERSKDELLSLRTRDLDGAADRTVSAWLTTRPAEVAETVMSWREE